MGLSGAYLVTPELLEQTEAQLNDDHGRQPNLDRTQKCNYIQQLEERLAVGTGLWPGLSHVLKALTPVHSNPWTHQEERDMIQAMYPVLTLANTVHGIACHMSQAGLWDRHYGWKEFIFEAEQAWAEILATPWSPASLHMRQVITGRIELSR